MDGWLGGWVVGWLAGWQCLQKSEQGKENHATNNSEAIHLPHVCVLISLHTYLSKYVPNIFCKNKHSPKPYKQPHPGCLVKCACFLFSMEARSNILVHAGGGGLRLCSLNLFVYLLTAFCLFLYFSPELFARYWGNGFKLMREISLCCDKHSNFCQEFIIADNDDTTLINGQFFIRQLALYIFEAQYQ